MDYLQYYEENEICGSDINWVLNLVINGLPSILRLYLYILLEEEVVLNLVINGLPSILS